jgi:two-component system sensor histidine kinase/response regulator
MTTTDEATVLVVDDSERNRALVSGLLSPRYRVVEAAGGAQALTLLESQSIDLVLLDVMMPEMDGFETCALLKGQRREEFLPILMLTALNDQQARNSGLAAGADDFLTKPVDRLELNLRVAAFVRLRRQDRTIRSQLEEVLHLAALKDDLISLIVHDLRNPLAGILAVLDLIRSGNTDPELLSDVQMAHRSASELRVILDDMLELRGLSQGHIPLRRESSRLSEVVSDALAAVAGTARAKEVHLNLLASDDVRLSVDRKLIRRAIENLVVNAIRHSPARSAVDVIIRQAPGGVAIEVSDAGPGVPDVYKPVLFDQYKSVEGTGGGGRRGFGLGLYQVKLVAAAHGGAASVRDREGGGATFRLVLPDGVAEAVTPPVPSVPAARRQSGTA